MTLSRSAVHAFAAAPGRKSRSAGANRLRSALRVGLLPMTLCCAVTSTHAVEYNRLQPDKSQIGFTFQQLGVKMDGRFRRFTADFAFDPAKPAAARAVLDVELASIDAGSPDAEQEVVANDVVVRFRLVAAAK